MAGGVVFIGEWLLWRAFELFYQGVWIFPGQTLLERWKLVFISGDSTLLLFFLSHSLLIGFILSWLYVLARPRLGPGPKTAVVVGALVFALRASAAMVVCLMIEVRPFWPVSGLIFTMTLLECLIATSLAGWQYIEKAP